jgi:hypothetical protein
MATISGLSQASSRDSQLSDDREVDSSAHALRCDIPRLLAYAT